MKAPAILCAVVQREEVERLQLLGQWERKSLSLHQRRIERLRGGWLTLTERACIERWEPKWFPGMEHGHGHGHGRVRRSWPGEIGCHCTGALQPNVRDDLKDKQLTAVVDLDVMHSCPPAKRIPTAARHRRE